MKKTHLIIGLILLTALAITACATMETATTIATVVGQGTGVISASQGESIRKSATAVSKTMEEFTPEQEYYIGRSVGAIVLSKYTPYDNASLNQYVNTIGQTLAAASDTPEIFGGYHFLVLDSNDINAFATPSGLIFVTRGLIRCCRSEDALAAVLAHEVSHIQLRHGMQAIEKARMTEALTILATEGAKNLGSREVAQLTQTFSGTISDIANTMINNGYSRSFEYKADQTAITILRRVGYNPGGLVDMLQTMTKNIKPGGVDFAKTHPAPQDRIAEIQKINVAFTGVASSKSRDERFQKAAGRI